MDNRRAAVRQILFILTLYSRIIQERERQLKQVWSTLKFSSKQALVMVSKKLESNAEVFFHLGLFYIRSNQIKKARESFEHALNLVEKRKHKKQQSEQETALSARISNHLASTLLFDQQKHQNPEEHLQTLSNVQNIYVKAIEV